MDFLEHEVFVLTFFCCISREFADVQFALDAIAFAVDHLDALATNLGNITLLEEEKVPGHR